MGGRRFRVVVSAILDREYPGGIGDIPRLGLSRERGVLDTDQRHQTTGEDLSDGLILNHFLLI